MDVRCWSSWASGEVVLVPRSARNLSSTPWNIMDVLSCWFRRLVTVFDITSTIPISLKSPIALLLIKTTVCHMLSSASVPSWNAAWTMVTNLCQLVASGVSYQVAAINQWHRFYDIIPNGLPERFRQSLHNRIYESNHPNANFNNLYFDGDERLIAGWKFYCVMMISYLGWSMVQSFTYKRIKCKKNKMLAWRIYWLLIETVHGITERSKDQTILFTFCLWYPYDWLKTTRL